MTDIVFVVGLSGSRIHGRLGFNRAKQKTDNAVPIGELFSLWSGTASRSHGAAVGLEDS